MSAPLASQDTRPAPPVRMMVSVDCGSLCPQVSSWVFAAPCAHARLCDAVAFGRVCSTKRTQDAKDARTQGRRTQDARTQDARTQDAGRKAGILPQPGCLEPPTATKGYIQIVCRQMPRATHLTSKRHDESKWLLRNSVHRHVFDHRLLLWRTWSRLCGWRAVPAVRSSDGLIGLHPSWMLDAAR